MKRREFIAGLAGAAAWPMAARAQQPEQMRRVGVLLSQAESDYVAQSYIATFAARLRELGWIEGKNRRELRRAALERADRVMDTTMHPVAALD